MEESFHLSPNNPLLTFILLLLTSLAVPPLFERLKIPGVVGLLLAGIILGPNGVHLLDADTETMELMAEIGKIYLMFVIGLEIDLAKFRAARNRSIGFGVLRFVAAAVFGIALGRFFGFGWNLSVLMIALLAPPTVLGYPIVSRLGVLANEAVTVAIGATILTDIAALVLLAICISIHEGEFSWISIVTQVVMVVIYAIAVLVGVDLAGKVFFRKAGDDEGNKFLFILLTLFLAAVSAQIIHVERIVGAFLAGLAVNNALENGPVKEKVEFVGSVIFIPFFFVGLGLLVDIHTLFQTLISSPGFLLAIVGAVLLSNLLAITLAKFIYRYSWYESLTMWSLSLPLVAAPLAAAIVGLRVDLIDIDMFNAVIVVMLVTAILGPVTTTQFASQLAVPTLDVPIDSAEPDLTLEDGQGGRHTLSSEPYSVMVAVTNPVIERYLVEAAALIARHESGSLLPLSIARSHVHMDDPSLIQHLAAGKKRLKQAMTISQTWDVPVQPILRIDDDLAAGISRAAREQHAHLIVMGWNPDATGLRARLFGTVIDSVFWASHCPVAVMRLLEEPANIHRILVPVRDLTPPTIRSVRFAQLFADLNQAMVTLLHVCDRRTPHGQISDFKDAIADILAQGGPQVPTKVKVVRHDDVAKTVLQLSQAFDLVIMRSMRRRTAGGLAVSNITTRVINELRCSVVLFGEPHS